MDKPRITVKQAVVITFTFIFIFSVGLLYNVNKSINDRKKKELERIEEQQVELKKKEIEEILPIHFNYEDVREPSNLTHEQIYKMLKGSPLQELSDEYLALEKRYDLNALFVMSLTIEESGWGKSNVAVNNNNISGQRINGVYRTFNSWEDCLKETYRLIREEYINPVGKYYVGSSNIYDINTTYCPDTAPGSWATNIIRISYDLRGKIN